MALQHLAGIGCFLRGRPDRTFLQKWWPRIRRGQILDKFSRWSVEVRKPGGTLPSAR